MFVRTVLDHRIVTGTGIEIQTLFVTDTTRNELYRHPEQTYINKTWAHVIRICIKQRTIQNTNYKQNLLHKKLTIKPKEYKYQWIQSVYWYLTLQAEYGLSERGDHKQLLNECINIASTALIH